MSATLSLLFKQKLENYFKNFKIGTIDSKKFFKKITKINNIL